MPTVITLQGADAESCTGFLPKRQVPHAPLGAASSYRRSPPMAGLCKDIYCLGADSSTAGEHPVGPVAAAVLSFVVVGAVVAGAVFVTRRRQGGLGGLFLCRGGYAGCDGPYPDNRWEDVLALAKKRRLQLWRGVRRPDFRVV